MIIVPSDAVGRDTLVLPRADDLADGFKMRRVLPVMHRRMIGPFVLIDQMGPADFDPGQPVRLVRGAELIALEPGIEIVLKAPDFHAARRMLMCGEPFPNLDTSMELRLTLGRADRTGRGRLAPTSLRRSARGG